MARGSPAFHVTHVMFYVICTVSRRVTVKRTLAPALRQLPAGEAHILTQEHHKLDICVHCFASDLANFTTTTSRCTQLGGY